MAKVRYFSESYTDKDSQLGGTPVTVADSPAVAELRRALADYPEDYNLHLQLAHQLGQQLRYHEAIEVLTEAVALQPQNPEAYRRRAPRYFSTLQFRQALADYEFCDRATPNSLDVLYRLGILCVAMGSYPRAKEIMTRCIALTEQDGEMQVACIFWYLAAYLRCHEPGEPNVGTAAYRRDMEVGHHFAYHTAVELLCGFISATQAAQRVDDRVDDLDHSMIFYGIYLHELVNGDAERAAQALRQLLARDFYWAGFAYVAALADSQRGSTLPSRLREFFSAHKRVALAFSGGADSAYLLYAALQCGCAVGAYYVHSSFQPAFELADAQRLAQQLEVPFQVLELDVLANRTVAENPADRCYHCKNAIFTAILQAARRDGFDTVVDGTNASDDAGDRPGMRALTELQVLSPLRIAGVTKAQLRAFSKQAGLFTWDKPAYACLATRVPTGRLITAADLSRVEWGEACLMQLGFHDLRLRLLDNGVLLQLPENQLDMLMKMRHTVYSSLSERFTTVLLDLNPRRKEV